MGEKGSADQYEGCRGEREQQEAHEDLQARAGQKGERWTYRTEWQAAGEEHATEEEEAEEDGDVDTDGEREGLSEACVPAPDPGAEGFRRDAREERPVDQLQPESSQHRRDKDVTAPV